MRSLITAPALLKQLIVVCHWLCGITSNYNTSQVRWCVSIKPGYCLMSPSTISVFVFDTQPPLQEETNVKRRGWEEGRWGRFLALDGSFQNNTGTIFITLNKVFHQSGFHLKLCHRANSVIMGGALLICPPPLSLVSLSGCLPSLVFQLQRFPHAPSASC